MSALVTGRLLASDESVAGMPQIRFHLPEPRDERTRGIALRHAAGTRDSRDARELGHLRGRRRQIEAHHVVDHDPVGEPVMQIGDGRQRVRARVDGAEILLESDRAHHRAHQHVASCLKIAAVAEGDRQCARGDAHAFQRDAVAERMIVGREVRLDVVCERVHTRRRRDGGRQIEGELGIGEDALGEECRREDDLLDVRRVVRDDRRTAHFRAGAGGRRERDEVGEGAVDRPNLRMVPRVFEDVAGMRGHQRNSLRDIERCAAAHPDHRVGVVRLVRRDALVHLTAHRVAPDARKDGNAQAGQRVDELP